MKRVIFLHGVGSSGAAMRPLAQQLALPLQAHFPDGLQPFDMGQGRQWFSVQGVTEFNRPARVAEALPHFRTLVDSFGDPRESLLIGFSQGAIMALHAAAEGLACAGVFALSGRLAGPVGPRAAWPPLWLLHGGADPVMPPQIAYATEAWLRAAGAAPQLELFNGLGHAIDERSTEVIRSAAKSLAPELANRL